MQPRQHRDVEVAGALGGRATKRHRLSQLRDTEPRRAPADGGAGARHETVTVRVALDDTENGGALGATRHLVGVVGDGIEIDDDARRRVAEQCWGR